MFMGEEQAMYTGEGGNTDDITVLHGMTGRIYFALGMGIIKITNTAFTMLLHNAFRSLAQNKCACLV